MKVYREAANGMFEFSHEEVREGEREDRKPRIVDSIGCEHCLLKLGEDETLARRYQRRYS